MIFCINRFLIIIHQSIDRFIDYQNTSFAAALFRPPGRLCVLTHVENKLRRECSVQQKFPVSLSIFKSQDCALVHFSLWSIKLWSPWKSALSSEWTRSLEHWLGSGQHYLDKYKCWGIFDSVPVSKMQLTVWTKSRSAKASGITLNSRRHLSTGVRLREEFWAYPSVGVVPSQRTSLKPSWLSFLPGALLFSGGGGSWRGSLCFEILNWPLRAPLETSAIIKARQAIV